MEPPIPTFVGNTGVLLLAAGASRRMGRPKMLLPWRSTTVVGHIVEQWLAVGVTQIGVVCAAHDALIAGELQRFTGRPVATLTNPSPQRGMFSSIQLGAAWPGWNTRLTHWIIALGDQPHLRTATLRKLLRQTQLHPDVICQPSHDGRGRHPLSFPKTQFERLRNSAGPTLKDFLNGLASSAIFRYEESDAGLDFDLDYPADYERARREFIPSAS